MVVDVGRALQPRPSLARRAVVSNDRRIDRCTWCAWCGSCVRSCFRATQAQTCTNSFVACTDAVHCEK
eukprot:3548678-Alexandrium_andersonii.AAC.1